MPIRTSVTDAGAGVVGAGVVGSPITCMRKAALSSPSLFG
jgi:hypothetical protein